MQMEFKWSRQRPLIVALFLPGAFVSLSSHPDISHGYVPKVLVREAVYGLSLLMVRNWIQNIGRLGV